jgi:hypothetical protein
MPKIKSPGLPTVKKSTPTPVKGTTPTATGKGMDPSSKADHAAIVKPKASKGRY